MNNARQDILEKLKKASVNQTLQPEPDFIEPLYHAIGNSLSESFKNAIEQINGKVFFFESEEELFLTLKRIITENSLKQIFCLEPDILQNLKTYKIPFLSGKSIPEDIEAGITGCEFLIARTGSAIVSSKQPGARQIFVYPPIHFIIAKESQLVDSLEAAYQKIQDKYSGNFPSMISLISGPSRTADIEKTLVLGAHGPKELHIFISK
ncbi:MAG: LUD domain-containing protein [Prolixibacteraceae bacterium]|nr:LUD domain-containing protein [Prolixibacteraceae bacterium]